MSDRKRGNWNDSRAPGRLVNNDTGEQPHATPTPLQRIEALELLAAGGAPDDNLQKRVDDLQERLESLEYQFAARVATDATEGNGQQSQDEPPNADGQDIPTDQVTPVL